MADVVGQRQSFGQILVKPQDGGHRAGDLRHFDGVRQTVSEMIAEAGCEYLCLGLQPAEGARMHDAVAVALERVTGGMRGFRVTAPSAALHWKPEMAEHGVPGYWGGRLPSARGAARLTEPGLARRGPSSFRASAGLVGASILASMIAAWSVETNTVGLSISDRSICSPGPGLPSAK